MKKQNQSLDTNIEPTTQTITKTSASLIIPEQTVRRHSVGNVASASIVERLQAIAAQKPQSNAPNKANGNRNVGVSTDNKVQPVRGRNPANRGRGNQIRGRGGVVTNSGTNPVRPVYPTNIQNKRTSNPDLATIGKGNNMEGAMLKPIANQMAARRFSSDMRITEEQPGSLNVQRANSRGLLGRS